MAIKEANDYLGMRLNEKLKKEFDTFCRGIGLKSSQVIKLFVIYCIERNAIPFNSSKFDTSEDDDKYIRVSIRLSSELRQKFSDVCGKYGLPMSVFIRDFMQECVTKKALPFDLNDKVSRSSN